MILGEIIIPEGCMLRCRGKFASCVAASAIDFHGSSSNLSDLASGNRSDNFDRFFASVHGINLLCLLISFSDMPYTFAVSLNAERARYVTCVDIIATLSYPYLSKTYFIISSLSFHEKSRSISGGEERLLCRNLSK